MRTCLISLLTLAALQGHAPGAHAHIGDEIYPFFELLDEDMARIDLTDGSVEDWLEVVGEPSLTSLDFYWWGYEGDLEYDPSDGWTSASGSPGTRAASTLWIAMERFDNLYFNLYDWGDIYPFFDPGRCSSGIPTSVSLSTATTPAWREVRSLPGVLPTGAGILHGRASPGEQPSGAGVGGDRRDA